MPGGVEVSMQVQWLAPQNRLVLGQANKLETSTPKRRLSRCKPSTVTKMRGVARPMIGSKTASTSTTPQRGTLKQLGQVLSPRQHWIALMLLSLRKQTTSTQIVHLFARVVDRQIYNFATILSLRMVSLLFKTMRWWFRLALRTFVFLGTGLMA